MKKIVFSSVLMLSVVLSVFSQDKTLLPNKDSSSLVVISSGAAPVGYGFFVSKDLVITTINTIGNYKSAQVLLADGKYHEVLGYVSADPENDLVLLKTDSVNVIPVVLKSQIPAIGEKVFLMDKKEDNKLVMMEAKLKDIKNFGEVKLLSFESSDHLKASGLPVYDASGNVIGLSVYQLVDDPGINFAIPTEILEKLIANQGELKKLFLLMPAWEDIKKRSLASSDKSKAVTEFLDQGVKRYEIKDYNGAIEKYNMVLRLSPNDADALVLRGQARYMLMQYKDALEDFNKAIALQPEYAEAYDLRGLCKAELGDNPGACEDWKTSFEKGYSPAFKLLENFCDLDD
ncbi:MAG TPA: tetratricopeptide repeat protein [Bacteroidales bacterium]|nr:tetratricopeptide repeat protein [Bacteroidales bacterium]